MNGNSSLDQLLQALILTCNFPSGQQKTEKRFLPCLLTHSLISCLTCSSIMKLFGNLSWNRINLRKNILRKCKLEWLLSRDALSSKYLGLTDLRALCLTSLGKHLVVKPSSHPHSRYLTSLKWSQHLPSLFCLSYHLGLIQAPSFKNLLSKLLAATDSTKYQWEEVKMR